MHKSLLPLLALTLPFLTLAGNARIVNNCPCQVTIWSVGSTVSGPWTLATSGGTYSEPFVKDPVSGGKSLKITLEPDGLYTGKAQTNFAYNLDGTNVWYDLSDVFGDPFAGKKIEEKSGDEKCPSITWENGVSPGGSQVKVCDAGSDVTLTLCSA